MQNKLQAVLEGFVGLLNDSETREKVVEAFYQVLNADIHVMEYAVICDERNNPPHVVAENQLYAHVRIREIGAEEFSLYELKISHIRTEEIDDKSNID